MPRNTSVTIGKHFSDFINKKIKAGRFESTSEAVRAGLRLLEADEAKLDVLRSTLTEGKNQIDQGKATDGELFMTKLTDKYE
ncbi:MAG: type II toxin-antitoxin system ParD family antitoxin [Burkholderiales bacterium]|nr:type II toxin-antitoxin system ParD family antitoxin [Burkholderiales bacterium]MDR4518682.1 type II toxin-antitoxin system ParD family antitoxin [Nitrosomonas sp.]